MPNENEITINVPTSEEVKASVDPNAVTQPVVEPTTETVVGDFSIPTTETEYTRPEKFKTEADMAKAYAELEKKLYGGGEKTEVPAESTQEAPKEFSLAKYNDEFADSGGLSTASYADLAKEGFNRETVDQFIAGNKAVALAKSNQVYNAVGGKDMFDQAVVWASENWAEGKIKAFNTQIGTGDIDTASFAAESLMAEFKSNSSFNPELLKAKPAVRDITGAAPFASQQQWLDAIADPKYKVDEAFRKNVSDRLLKSNI